MSTCPRAHLCLCVRPVSLWRSGGGTITELNDRRLPRVPGDDDQPQGRARDAPSRRKAPRPPRTDGAPALERAALRHLDGPSAADRRSLAPFVTRIVARYGHRVATSTAGVVLGGAGSRKRDPARTLTAAGTLDARRDELRAYVQTVARPRQPGIPRTGSADGVRRRPGQCEPGRGPPACLSPITNSKCECEAVLSIIASPWT
mmetsp:Transcript_15821/g.63694  ORF Transcript_15821/g.63694 Transcript_15821/m.63694 type:complete len:203 (+) Transcript_15821:560-1168(+)